VVRSRWARRAGWGLALLFAASGAALIFAALTLLSYEDLALPALLPGSRVPLRAAASAAVLVGTLWLGIGALSGWLAAGRRAGH
jgi:hypothetical protein